MDVTLTPTELQIAVDVGAARQLGAIRDGKQDKHGAKADKAWTLHIEGAAGELAVAKALGVYFPATVDTYRNEPDLPHGIEVRTRSQDYYDLLLRHDDSPDGRYVLVVGRPPALRIPGWIVGADGKQDRWLKSYANRPPAFFVPQDALHPIETLTEVIAA